MQEAEDQAAELNAQLQDRVDELMEKLSKYSAPMLNIEELGQGEDGIPFESVCKAYSRATHNRWSRTQASSKACFRQHLQDSMHHLFSRLCLCNTQIAMMQAANPACVVPR